MTPAAIMEEYQRCPGLRQRDIDALIGMEIVAHALAFDYDGRPAPLARDRVCFGPVGRFEFARHSKADAGEWAYVWPLLDSGAEIADIGAWRPGGSFGTWLGHVAMFGAERCCGPRLGTGPLPVHEEPLAWLRCHRNGIVILDYWQALPDLYAAAPLLVATALHGRYLRDALTVPVPQILVDQVAQ